MARKDRRCHARPAGVACPKTGDQVLPGVYLCPEHEQELLVELTRRDGRRKAAKLTERGRRKKAEAIRLEQARERKRRDREAHQVAEQAAGELKPSIDWRKSRGRVWEISGGLPTLGKDR